MPAPAATSTLDRNQVETERRRFSREPQGTSVSGLIEALSFALDLTEGARPGHAVRTCVLGMRIGRALGLADDLLNDLYYALLLKDVGCSSNAARLFQIVGNDEMGAKRLTRTTDWTRFEWKQMQYLLKHAHSKLSGPRRLRHVASMVCRSSANGEDLIRLCCDKGAKVVRDLGLGHATAGAIFCLDEHWDGSGYPDHLVGEDIPLLARIASVAQTFEVFLSEFGVAGAIDVLQRRSGRWFDPAIIRTAVGLERRGELTRSLSPNALADSIAAIQPAHRRVFTDAYTIDSICVAFAGVVDAKSPFTYRHSSGVAAAAVRIGQQLHLPAREIVTLRRAALLHDIGKLSVPNCILDKRGALTSEEWKSIRQHPHYTFEILRRITGFDEIATIAASHHEKLDGSGYHLGLRGEQLPLLSRILTVADMYDALSGDRPYRARLTTDQVFDILRKDAPHAIDATCLDALESFAGDTEIMACS